MPDLDEHGRPAPPIAADETASVLGFLEFHRATKAWKCAGVDLIREAVDGVVGE